MSSWIPVSLGEGGGQLSNVLYSQLKLWSPNVEFDMNSPELLPVFDEGDVKLLSLDD